MTTVGKNTLKDLYIKNDEGFYSGVK